MHDDFQKKHKRQLRIGTEPEMMWLKFDENGKPGDGYSKPYCYHIDQFESLRPVTLKVIEYCRKMGLDKFVRRCRAKMVSKPSAASCITCKR